MKLRLVISFFVLTTFCNAVAAGVYKWVDENGQIHYGDAPRGEQTTKSITIHTSPEPDPHTLRRLEAQKKYLDARQTERAAANEAKEKAEKLKAENKQQCKQAKDALAMLQNGGRLYFEKAAGERHYITDQERQNGINAAKSNVKKYCL